MPHSSGGGSHSSGRHTSSHSSSYGRNYTSSNYNSSRERINRTLISKEQFTDSLKKTDKTMNGIFMFGFTIVLLIGLIMLFGIMDINIPIKLIQNYKYEIEIEDNADVLGNTNELKKILQEFYDKTGIVPAIITVNNEDWQEKYTSLEKYAYDLYLLKFSDEKHWLIVYSEPKNFDSYFNDWYWEGIQGNDTDSILTVEKTDQFSQKLQNYLNESSQYTVCSAINQTFNDINPVIMKCKIKIYDFSIFFFAIIWIAVDIYIIYCYFKETKEVNKNHIKTNNIKSTIVKDDENIDIDPIINIDKNENKEEDPIKMNID